MLSAPYPGLPYDRCTGAVRELSLLAGALVRHTCDMADVSRDTDFDEVVLPHLDAAHRLARWLMRNEHDAEDVVQEASLRAFRYFRTFTGGSGRAWFLRIVRNTCISRRSERVHATDAFDEERHRSAGPAADPETLLLRADAAAVVERTLDGLPDRFRELLVLRELEGLSYRELADAIGIPMGTVMSGLSRARLAFRGALHTQLQQSPTPARKNAARSPEYLAVSGDYMTSVPALCNSRGAANNSYCESKG